MCAQVADTSARALRTDARGARRLIHGTFTCKTAGSWIPANFILCTTSDLYEQNRAHFQNDHESMQYFYWSQIHVEEVKSDAQATPVPFKVEEPFDDIHASLMQSGIYHGVVKMLPPQEKRAVENKQEKDDEQEKAPALKPPQASLLAQASSFREAILISSDEDEAEERPRKKLRRSYRILCMKEAGK